MFEALLASSDLLRRAPGDDEKVGEFLAEPRP